MTENKIWKVTTSRFIAIVRAPHVSAAIDSVGAHGEKGVWVVVVDPDDDQLPIEDSRQPHVIMKRWIPGV